MVRTHTDGFSASKTHQEGRALDISTKEWDHQTAIDFTNFINDEFEHLGAISANDGKARAAIYHDVGLGKHIHLQVRN